MSLFTPQKILCVFGEHNYGDPARGQGYEYSNFLPALRALGHDVELFDSFSRAQHSDFAALNRALLETADRYCPDLIFCVLMGYEVWLETLALLHDTGVRLVNWGTDDSWKYAQFSRFLAPAFDLWITTSSDALQAARRDGCNNFVLSQWAANAKSLQEPLAASECRYPVSFVGSSYGNRPKWIAELKNRGIDVVCFGYGWPNGPVVAEEIPRIVRESVISLNFGDSGLHFQGFRLYRSRQIKARIFEVPGAGGCLLTESAEYLDSYFKVGAEIQVFENLDELADKIHYLLANSKCRDQMAVAAYHRIQTEHTYEVRFNEILAQLPKRTQFLPIDFVEFDAIAVRHQYSPVVKLIRNAIVTPFQLVWGKRRGLRAARRFLFELSWRLIGEKTYLSTGWPGRLFYHES